MADPARLSINQATARVQHVLRQAGAAYAAEGVPGIGVWRDKLADCGLDEARRLIEGHGLTVSGLCRGGMFPASTAAGRTAALDDNRRAVDEARGLDSPCLVLVVGGLPGALAGRAEHKDIAAARNDVRDGIAATLDYARGVGMRLAIEPLHPMYAADRACVNTMQQALDLCEALDPPTWKYRTLYAPPSKRLPLYWFNLF